VGPEAGVCGGFFPPYECLDGYAGRDFWAENRPAFLYAHKIAASPYASAHGPDAQSLVLTGHEMPGGGWSQLRATIADDRCCGDTPQPIAGAEYFLDAPGADGTGIPMGPVDGGWGDLSEECEALVDISELSLGRRLVLVHGRNIDGRWGPFSAVFLRINDRIYLPLISRG
jgi:hypothetical protein